MQAEEGLKTSAGNPTQSGNGRVPLDGWCPSARAWLEIREVMTRDVVTVSPDETMVSAAKIMSEHRVSCSVVVAEGRVAGILTETDFLKPAAGQCGNLAQVRVAEIMSSPVQTIAPSVSALEAGRIMEDRQIKRLPVLDGERLIGIVTQTDLVRIYTSSGLRRTVREIMSTDVASIPWTATAAEAAGLMTSRHISSIVAVSGAEPAGILTERDYLKRVVARRESPTEISVGEVMSSPLISAPPSCSLFSASKMMSDMGIRRLIILERGRLCGIVAQTDVFRALRNRLQEEEAESCQRLGSSSLAIFAVDLDGKTTYANPAFVRLLEAGDPAELVHQPFLPKRFWSKPDERLQVLEELASGLINAKELALRTLAGKEIRVVLFSTATRNGQGEINGSQGILYDVTGRSALPTSVTSA
ncbi:MAG: CBS domain-containing protein [Pirellulales bacterium]|nr:CBS domain-containing protein [Pirellulales bacterium]